MSYDQNAPSSIANDSQNIGTGEKNATGRDASDSDENDPYADDDDAANDYPPVDDAHDNATGGGSDRSAFSGSYARENSANDNYAAANNRPADNPIGAPSSDAAGTDTDTSRPTIIRVEVLLDRAHFSPGEIDGKIGGNLRIAIAAYRQTHGLGNSGAIDDALLKSLNATNNGTILQRYTITDEDENGPFLGHVSEDFRKLAKLKTPGYANQQEELAEKFHMSPALLDAFNPDVDYTKAGQSIVVARLTNTPLPSVSRIEVNKSAHQVRAFDQAGDVVGVFPATVGSEELPSPSGTANVVYVKHNPVYHYDPKALHFGPKSAGAFNIAPGPNNPVGTTWIALDRSGYGIHGTPNPRLIGKTQSHGCVRLTNWDADTLGRAVSHGTVVEFIGDNAPSRVASRD
jgi:lipoprotein-anchoring transpeptidase ErfK/SrfK